ncbi:hypothetical protein BC937DRAFT_93777 [Endogone sp. FLAS-F59071]|nr:hypothetical protein BC937DRAFT_93777 [Endogone sp. FLAS-F59071]|eukprot:RUS21048.1 hypothetical protein BC937DRAFT_93777 [Endogone sp. FLAS-F59071]
MNTITTTTTISQRQSLPVSASSRSHHQPRASRLTKGDAQANSPSVNKATRVKTVTKGKRFLAKHKEHSSDNDVPTALTKVDDSASSSHDIDNSVDVVAITDDTALKSALPSKKRNRPSKTTRDVLEHGTVTILKRGALVHVGDEDSSYQEDTQRDSPSNDRSYNEGDCKEHSTSRPSTHTKDHKRRNIVPPSKSRRAQRRKDVEVINDALQNVDADLVLSVTPPSPSPLSSNNDSDDSGDSISSTTLAKKVSNSKRRTSPRKDEKLVSVMTPKSSAFPTFPAKSGSDDLKSGLNHPLDNQRPTRPRRRSGSILELRSSHFLPLTPLSEAPRAPVSEPPLSRTPPASFLVSEKVSINSPLYAGPTFHNSPAPSALPLPSFYGRSLGEVSPLQSIMASLSQPFDNSGAQSAASAAVRSRTISLNSTVTHPYPKGMTTPLKNSLDEDLFQMDDLDDMPPTTTDALKQRSRELLGLLAVNRQNSDPVVQQHQPSQTQFFDSNSVIHPQQHRATVPSGFAAPLPTRSDPNSYGLPLRMATGEMQNRNPLSLEIQHNLRSMLKIEGRS